MRGYIRDHYSTRDFQKESTDLWMAALSPCTAGISG